MFVPLAIIEYSYLVRTRWVLYLFYMFSIQHGICEKLSILQATLTRTSRTGSNTYKGPFPYSPTLYRASEWSYQCQLTELGELNIELTMNITITTHTTNYIYTDFGLLITQNSNLYLQ